MALLPSLLAFSCASHIVGVPANAPKARLIMASGDFSYSLLTFAENWRQEFDFAEDPTADSFMNAPKGGDNNPENGIDVEALLYYAGHGSRTKWALRGEPNDVVPGSHMLVGESRTASSSGQLRYLLMCSCNVLAHGRYNGGTKDYEDPATPCSRCATSDSEDCANAAVRWRDRLGAGFKTICGGSSDLSTCSSGRGAERLWQYYDAGLGPAASAIMGFADTKGQVALCLAKGSSWRDSPLSEKSFSDNPNPVAPAKQSAVYAEYPEDVVDVRPVGAKDAASLPSGVWTSGSVVPRPNLKGLESRCEEARTEYLSASIGSRSETERRGSFLKTCLGLSAAPEYFRWTNLVVQRFSDDACSVEENAGVVVTVFSYLAGSGSIVPIYRGRKDVLLWFDSELHLLSASAGRAGRREPRPTLADSDGAAPWRVLSGGALREILAAKGIPASGYSDPSFHVEAEYSEEGWRPVYRVDLAPVERGTLPHLELEISGVRSDSE